MTASLRFASPEDAPTLFVERPVTIHDARHHDSPRCLDHNGYVLVRHHSAVPDFYDAGEVRRAYYPEMAQLVQNLTGATEAVVYTHSVRCASRADDSPGGILRPFKSIHNDYTTASGPQRVREALGTNARLMEGRRYCIINVWRPIRGPVDDSPLALCDVRSLSASDLVSTPSQDPTGKFLRIYTLAFNARQHWSYFPDMESSEVVMFKTFESADHGMARFTPHSAFDHPNTSADAPQRESVEVRVIALFA